MDIWRQAQGNTPDAGCSMAASERMLPQRGGNLLEAAQEVMMQADHLGDDDIGVFAVLRKGFHHGAKQGLR